MKYIELSNKKVPAIGMGTWYMGEEPANFNRELSTLQTGIEAGLTLIDTAEMYGEGLAETLVGQAIQPYTREDLTLVSKVYPHNATAEGTRISLENSLRRLGTDYLDVYLLHWRGEVPLAETVEIFEQLKLEGKILSWGVSNFDVPDMEELETLTANCATNQVLYHMASRGIEFDLKPWMDQRAMPLMAYSPLGHGGQLKGGFSQNPALQEMAAHYEITVQQLLLAWVTSHGNTIAIPKASTPAHVLANRTALDIHLSLEDLFRINALYPKPTTKVPLDEL